MNHVSIIYKKSHFCFNLKKIDFDFILAKFWLYFDLYRFGLIGLWISIKKTVL